MLDDSKVNAFLIKQCLTPMLCKLGFKMLLFATAFYQHHTQLLYLFSRVFVLFYLRQINPYVLFGSPVTRFKLKLYDNYALVFLIGTRHHDILHNRYINTTTLILTILDKSEGL